MGKPDGSPDTVFTPYSKAWKKLPLPNIVKDALTGRFVPVPESIQLLAIPETSTGVYFKAGEEEAERRLREFLDGGVYDYQKARNRLDLDGTSSLSPYFRFGMLSSRRAILSVMEVIRNAPEKAGRAGAETWLNELIWREFYHSILYHFPDVSRQTFRPEMRGIEWNQDQNQLSAWKNGMTGYPVVDASMRQLATLGWMHNRGRMITASFLVKDLLINWQQGEEWFMRQLVDGDLAANNGGWQWTAGVGTDAAPYFKIFNFVKHLFLLSGKIGGQVIARQDKRVVTRQEPKKTGLKIGEKMMQSDHAILTYRQHRSKLKALAGQQDPEEVSN